MIPSLPEIPYQYLRIGNGALQTQDHQSATGCTHQSSLRQHHYSTMSQQERICKISCSQQLGPLNWSSSEEDKLVPVSLPCGRSPHHHCGCSVMTVSPVYQMDPRQGLLCWVFCEQCPLPQADLFAMEENHCLNTCVSPVHNPMAAGVDTITVKWSQWDVIYLSPPWNLLSKVFELAVNSRLSRHGYNG